MQVTLTPQAEKLLRHAMARNPGTSAADVLEQVLAERLARPTSTGNSLRLRLASLTGVKMPAHWPPRFKPVEAIRLKGELPSERLVRERR